MREARAIMAELAASGLAPEQSALVMELMAAVTMEARPDVDVQAERRREKDRERKRNLRNSAESAESAEPAPSLNKENPPDPLKKLIPPRVSATPARATRISLDWTPAKPLPPEVAELCAQWPPGRLERELGGFRDYWVSRSKDAARTDWDRTWWNRIRDQHDRVMRDSRNGRPAGTDRMAGNDGLGLTTRAARDFLADHGELHQPYSGH